MGTAEPQHLPFLHLGTFPPQCPSRGDAESKGHVNAESGNASGITPPRPAASLYPTWVQPLLQTGKEEPSVTASVPGPGALRSALAHAELGVPMGPGGFSRALLSQGLGRRLPACSPPQSPSAQDLGTRSPASRKLPVTGRVYRAIWKLLGINCGNLAQKTKDFDSLHSPLLSLP